MRRWIVIVTVALRDRSKRAVVPVRPRLGWPCCRRVRNTRGDRRSLVIAGAATGGTAGGPAGGTLAGGSLGVGAAGGSGATIDTVAVAVALWPVTSVTV